MDSDKLGNSSSSLKTSQCRSEVKLKCSSKESKARKRRCGRPEGRFPVEIGTKSLQKLPEYFTLKYKTSDTSAMTEDDQRDFIADLKSKKLWEDLLFLNDKRRARNYISKKADEIRRQHNNVDFKKVVSAILLELKLSSRIIESWCPEFRAPSPGTTPSSPPTTTASSPLQTTTTPAPYQITTTTTASQTTTTLSSPTTTTTPSSETTTTKTTAPSQTITTTTASPTATTTLSSATTTTTLSSPTTATIPSTPTTTTHAPSQTTTTTKASSPLQTTTIVSPPTLPPTTTTMVSPETTTTAASPKPPITTTTSSTSSPPLPTASSSAVPSSIAAETFSSTSSILPCFQTGETPIEIHNTIFLSKQDQNPVVVEKVGDDQHNHIEVFQPRSSPLFISPEKSSQSENNAEADNGANPQFLDSFYSLHDSESDSPQTNNLFMDPSSQNSENFIQSQKIFVQELAEESGGSSGMSLFDESHAKDKTAESDSEFKSNNRENSLNCSDFPLVLQPDDIKSNASESQEGNKKRISKMVQLERTSGIKSDHHDNSFEFSETSQSSSNFEMLNNKLGDKTKNTSANENAEPSLLTFETVNNNNNNNSKNENSVHAKQDSTPLTISTCGSLMTIPITDLKTWELIENFSLIHGTKMISHGIEILTTETSINRHVDGVVSCVHINHWIFIEVDFNTNMILIHDPDISTTSPRKLRGFLDKFEKFLDDERRPKIRQHQILDGSEEASRLKLETGEFCLKLLHDGKKNFEEPNGSLSVQVKSTTFTVDQNQSDNLFDTNGMNHADDKSEPREDPKTENKTRHYNSGSNLVWVDCCEMFEKNTVNCSLCTIYLHEDCAVFVGSNAEGFVYFCISCEQVKIHEENYLMAMNNTSSTKSNSPKSQKQEINEKSKEKNIQASPEGELNKEQVECLLTAQDICDALCVDNSAVDYSPPLSFSIILRKEEVEEMFSFHHAKTGDGKEVVQVSFNPKSWAATLSEAMIRSDIPCSFSATHTPFLCQSTQHKKGTKSNEQVSQNFAHCYGKCSGKCNLKFTAIFPEKPEPGRSLKCEFKTKGSFKLEQDETTARRVSGSQRSKVKDVLKNSKTNKVYLDRVSHLNVLHLLHKNKKAMTPGVLRTAKWEGKTEKRSDKNEARDLENILVEQKKNIYPESDLPGYLRNLITIDQFQYDMVCFPQVKLTNILAHKAEVWITIDASSRIARRPNDEKIEKKAVFNYIMDVSVDGVQPFTLAELVTTNNKSSNIKSFMTRVFDEVKRAGQHLPKVVTGVISDMSMALIHASCESINIETFKSYIQRSYRIVRGQEKHPKNKSIIIVCSNHTLSAFVKNVKKRSLDKNIKKVAVAILARIMEARDLTDLQYYARRATRILGCHFLDEETLNSYIQDISTKNIDNFENLDEEIDILDFEEDVEEFQNQNSPACQNSTEESSQQVHETSNNQQHPKFPVSNEKVIVKTQDQKYSVLKTNNNFYLDFVRIRKECCPDLPEILNPKSIENFLKSQKISKKKIQNKNQSEDNEGNAEDVNSDNPYFCLKVLELLENYYIPMLPFIGSMVPKHCGFPSFLRRTNAVNESSFKINKHQWHLTRDMNNGDFVREHFQLIHGKIKDVMSNVRKNRKMLQVPLVSLKCAEKETKSEKPGPLGPLEGHKAVENWGGQGDVKVKSKVKKEPKHLSSVDKLNENQLKRMTRSQKGEKYGNDEVVVRDTGVPEVTSVILGVSSHGNITDENIQCLFKGNLWLNSDLMNEFSYILCDEYDSLPLRKKFLGRLDILSSYAIVKTKTGEYAANQSCFQRISDSADTLFFPLNVNDVHWILIKVEKVQTDTRIISVHDSKPSETPKTDLMKIIEILKASFDLKFETKQWEALKLVKTTNQRNKFNCGPATLFLMDLHIQDDVNRKYSANYLSEYRLQILRKILKTTQTGRGILRKNKTDDALKCFVLEKKEEMLKIQNKINSK